MGRDHYFRGVFGAILLLLHARFRFRFCAERARSEAEVCKRPNASHQKQQNTPQPLTYNGASGVVLLPFPSRAKQNNNKKQNSANTQTLQRNRCATPRPCVASSARRYAFRIEYRLFTVKDTGG